MSFQFPMFFFTGLFKERFLNLINYRTLTEFEYLENKRDIHIDEISNEIKSNF